MQFWKRCRKRQRSEKSLTNTQVIFSWVEQTTTAFAFITPPGIFAAALWALAGQFLSALIHICNMIKTRSLYQICRIATRMVNYYLRIKFNYSLEVLSLSMLGYMVENTVKLKLRWTATKAKISCFYLSPWFSTMYPNMRSGVSVMHTIL